MTLTQTQCLYLREMYSYGGVHIGLFAQLGHRIGLVDEEIYDKALDRIYKTDPEFPGTHLVNEYLIERPVCLN
ncbi:hypothetical protein [Dyadobacter sp. LHD-138]|uniref:hypothetical protein n=1 Tax=Dyadobacter sp. LHD-138 TaxID=3071413 RepID=UPI0027DF0B47|nr:hypothetical protein [Dyadobacter sp. LHD-138]MDQ6482337.1 hypothetical protein [Dyadobacter sp. LHD-138]